MYVFLLLYVVLVSYCFFVDSAFVLFVCCTVFLWAVYLFCLCVVLCSSGQGRMAVADCLEVKFINQIKSIKPRKNGRSKGYKGKTVMQAL